VSRSVLAIFLIFLKLGSTCFGGVVAALVLFHREFVQQRHWIDEKTYMDLVALSQSLPGPVSSQVAIALGIQQQGLWGGVAALMGFILPSALLLIAAAYGMTIFVPQGNEAWLHGLRIAVVAVVAQAIWTLGKRVCMDEWRMTITVVATMITIFVTSFLGQILAILCGAIAGKLLLTVSTPQEAVTRFPERFISPCIAIVAGVLFLILLFVPSLINAELQSPVLALFDRFFRTGALVFGGGHVVLPLLQSQFVETGWVDGNTFLAGYGLVQALPGPLFNFAAFLGAVMDGPLQGWMGGVFAMVAIFLPSFLLLIGILPIWEKWRHHSAFQTILAGMSAAVLGLLISAFYNPVWTNAILSAKDFAVALVAFVLLEFWCWPQWLVVIMSVIGTVLVYPFFK